MKHILKIEATATFILFAAAYFHYYPGQWVLFIALFFVPDVSFAGYLISPKAGAIAYNFMHHMGVMILLLFIGVTLDHDLAMKVSLIFLSHSAFDRIFGYGLKYYDQFNHTHLGWIGKKAEA